MDFYEVIRKRRSVRAFRTEPIPQESLQRILEAAAAAPSAGNLQALEIFLVTDPDKKARLATAALYQDFIAQAAVVLVFCANPARSSQRYGDRGRKLYSIQDATIACTYAMLAAVAEGLGTVWIGAFSDEAVRSVLSIPATLEPVAVLPVGFAAEEPAPTARRELSDLIHRT